MADLNGSSEADNKLSKRVSHLIGVGAVPAALISTLGDFFGPKGGWLIVGLIGVAALVLCAYLLFSLSINDKTPPIWYRITSGDKELNWIWSSQPPVLSHGVHVVALFGLICLFCAGKTYAALDGGGYIAKNVDAVSAAQVKLGLALLEEQKKTNDSLGTLVATAKTLKLETSDNPRKELANLQLSWDSVGFERAIQQSDLHALQLFIASKFPVGNRTFIAAERALERGNSETQLLLSTYLSAESVEHCMSLFSAKPFREVAAPDPAGKALAKAVCSSSDVRSAVRAKVNEAKARYEKHVAEKKKWDSRSAAERRKNDERVTACMEDAGVRVLMERINCGPGTMDPGAPSDAVVKQWRNIADWIS